MVNIFALLVHTISSTENNYFLCPPNDALAVFLKQFLFVEPLSDTLQLVN